MSEDQDIDSNIIELPTMQTDRVLSVICDLNNDSTVEQFAQAMGVAADLMYVARVLKQAAEQRAVAYIKANGEVQIGDKRYYLGHDKTWKPINDAAIMDEVLEKTGGDADAVIGCLSANPWKRTAVKAIISDADKRLFKCEVKDKLKDGAPAPKKLQVVDERFLPKKG